MRTNKNIRRKSLLIGLWLGIVSLSAQTDSSLVEYNINLLSNVGIGKQAPFLSTANQWDRHSFSPNSLTLWGTIHKRLKAHSVFDYGFGAELTTNLSVAETRFFPDELYIDAKVGPFVFTAGRKQAVYGNQDPILSSGGMLWSRNARPMPRLSLESFGYIPVPFTHQFVEVKGGITHGWFIDSTLVTNTLLHYKYAGIRLGGTLPVHLNYSLHHVAQWGGTSSQYGTSPANFDNFLRVLMGKSGDESAPATERYNTLGNHIISKNIGLEFTFKNANIEVYWQNIYEDKPIHYMYKTYNQEDGLWGLSLQLPKYKPLNRLMVEFLSTTDMSGPWHDLDGLIYGGADGYYNNGVYTNGWSFYGMTIGNPWLTSPKYNQTYEQGAIGFINNMVRVYHVAGTGQLGLLDYTAVFAYTRNFGTTHPVSVPTVCNKQYSWLLNTEMPFPYLKQTRLTMGFSGDLGKQYGNNYALLVGLRWEGRLTW